MSVPAADLRRDASLILQMANWLMPLQINLVLPNLNELKNIVSRLGSLASDVVISANRVSVAALISKTSV